MHWGSRDHIITAGLSLALLLAAALPAAAAFTPPQGSVDWVGGFIDGVGYGSARPTGNRPGDRIRAIRAAEVMAQRALAETIHGVRVSGDTKVGDAVKAYMLESRVQGLIRGARKVKENVSWDGPTPSATVTLRVCMSAGAPECRSSPTLVGVLAEGGGPGSAPGNGPDGRSLISRKKSRLRADGGKPSYDPSRPVTGLVLELRAPGHVRELFPVVAAIGDGGAMQTVFSAKRVKPEVIRTYGVARYADSMPQAKGNDRVGGNPLVVPVTEVTADNRLIVPGEGARVIKETTRYGNDYLAEARVVIAGK